MGLDFTQTESHDSVSVYLVHNGTVSQRRAVEHLAASLDAHLPGRHIVILSGQEPEGSKLCDFYTLSRMAFPHVLVVRDNDQIGQMWSGPHLPTVEHLAHTLRAEVA